MSSAKRKHKDLERLFTKFTNATAHLIAHPELNDDVRGFLLDCVNDIESEFGNTPVAWAAEHKARLPYALRAAQEQREQSND